MSKLLPEQNTREGYFKVAELDRLLKLLPDEVRPVVEFGDLHGLAARRAGADMGTTWTSTLGSAVQA